METTVDKPIKQGIKISDENFRLEAELEKLKRKVGLGFEVNVRWLPGEIKFKDGKKLEEEVIGNTIFIYEENPTRAKMLLAHGLAEWLLNQHTKKYRLLINKLIEVFEQIQYEEKEKIVDAISNLISQAGEIEKDS
jgi:hypothetical protein